MLVTLIGKNVLYKLKLPTKKTGNYWITDDDGKKLINIVGKNNEWQMYSNEQVKILNPHTYTLTLCIKVYNIKLRESIKMLLKIVKS